MSRLTQSSGQTSLEFIVMLSFIMLVFAAFYTFFADQQMAVREENEAMFAESIANQLSYEIKIALTQGDGYARNFTLPAAIVGHSYTANVTSGFVAVRWNNRSVFANGVVENITGTVEPGENYIQNVEGELHVE